MDTVFLSSINIRLYIGRHNEEKNDGFHSQRSYQAIQKVPLNKREKKI